MTFFPHILLYSKSFCNFAPHFIKYKFMNGEKLTPITNKPSLWALSPLLVFLCLYLVTSIIVNDFYKVPITIAFMVSSVYAVCITKGLSLNERMLQYSIGAANKNIMLMIWISSWQAHSPKVPKISGPLTRPSTLRFFCCRTICCWQASSWLPVSSHSPSEPR